MPPINVLIKPASSSCNLKCKYCFYYDVVENRGNINYGMMAEDTLKSLVKRVLEYADHYAGFTFQGGEPTLAGIDFYKRLIELQKKYNIKKLKINNAIQTNGMIIDEEWAKFLSENKFLVGLSLDGPKEVHDLNRMDIKGNGSYKKIENSIKLFKKYKVDFNILCVVTKVVVRHVEKVYNYFSKMGFEFLQFIPCLDKLGDKPGKNPYSLTNDYYEEFLKKLFDLWYRDFLNGRHISIRMFDNIVQMFLGLQPEACDMKGCCSANVVIEADGSIYPCDFYVIDQWKMGYIQHDSIEEMLQEETARKFVETFSRPSEVCRQCEFLSFCRGGCRRHYEPIDNNKIHKNYYCLAYKGFYKHTIERFYHIARRIGSLS